MTRGAVAAGGARERVVAEGIADPVAEGAQERRVVHLQAQQALQRADAAKRQLEEADSLRVQTDEAAQQKAKAARTQQSGGGAQAMDSEETLPANGKEGQESTLTPP